MAVCGLSCHFELVERSSSARLLPKGRKKSKEIMSKQYYTYILANKTDTTLYFGVTNNLERRMAEHRSGMIPGFTQKYNCHKLVYYETFSDVEQAIAREKQLKKWSRAKKDWLIDSMNKERSDLMP